MITYAYKLDMAAGKKPPDIFLSRGDTDVTIIFNLYASDGILVIEEGTAVSGGGTRPDGEQVTFDASLDIAHRRVEIDVPEEMTEISGTGRYEIILTCEDKELHSSNFKVHVERRP